MSGAGGLVDDQGNKHHVRFSATITAGGAGTGAVAVTFSGRDYNEQYNGTVSSGQITVAS
ncbi:MAG TPA: hypothetical protein VIR57_01185 [Chloroflexota bacterium]|jgi:hypothetical protein